MFSTSLIRTTRHFVVYCLPSWNVSFSVGFMVKYMIGNITCIHYITHNPVSQKRCSRIGWHMTSLLQYDVLMNEIIRRWSVKYSYKCIKQ